MSTPPGNEYLRRMAREALEAPVVGTLSQWADSYRWISFGVRWSTARTPYLAAIMDAISDPAVREVNLCFGSQCGKTEVLFNFIGYIAHVLPAMMLYMSSTKDLARDAGRVRLDAMVYASPALTPLFGVEHGKSTKAGALALGLKRFRGGGVKIASSQSPSDVLSHPIPYVLCDEIDRYGTDRETVIQLAKARSSTFPWAKLICVSTPYGEDSLILDRVRASGDARYLVPCPHCKEAYEWRWEQVTHCGVGVPLHICPKCDGILRTGGPAPLALLQQGRWSTNTGRSRGFRLSSLYSPFMSLDELWAEYAQARRSANSQLMSTFCRDRMAREYLPHEWSFDIPTSGLAPEALPVSPPPPPDAVRTVGIDVQHDRVEFTILDSAREGVEMWFYDHAVLYGDTTKSAIYDQLYSYLKSCRPTMCSIDAGDGTHTHHVLAWVESVQGRLPVVATKGAHPWHKKDGTIARVMKGNAYGAPFIRFAAGHYKGLVQAAYQGGKFHGLEAGALELENPEPRLSHYVRGLFAEREEPTRFGGTRWVVLAKYNEPLDCVAMARVAYDYAFASKTRPRKIVR